MTLQGIGQIAFYLLIILLLSRPLGWYIAKVFIGTSSRQSLLGGSIERSIYRFCGIRPSHEMDWKGYLSAMLIFNLMGIILIYIIQRLQVYLPLNPQQFSSPSPDLAFNTAISFMTNTDWQAYSGETAMSYLVQMMALTSANFFSAATGISLFMALIRGLNRHESKSLGNFWVDTVRGTLYILLPLSFILSLILVSQGVIQNLSPNQIVNLIDPITYQQPVTDLSGQLTPQKDGASLESITVTQQVIPMGPVASQTAISQLGTNGGGFFNVNSSHPLANPNPLTNFFEMLAILLIPASLCCTFGILVNDKRQGWALLAAMYIVFIPYVLFTEISEQIGNPILTELGIDQKTNEQGYPGGNMEGKETRFGIVNSALWSVATTSASNGSVNSMLDSYTPVGFLSPLWMMHLGEVIFGGVGSGLSGMLMMVVITVFVSGLMVGRTPEYLGKKIEPFEMKMASLAVLIMPLIVLLFTAVSTVTKLGVDAIGNPGVHGFSEILYGFTSMANNNGSALAGLHSNTPFYNILGGIIMLIGRYWVAISVIAIAGSLARKKVIPTSSGTLATHTPLFILLLIGIMILLGALSFFPALALGPIVEHLMLWGSYGD